MVNITKNQKSSLSQPRQDWRHPLSTLQQEFDRVVHAFNDWFDYPSSTSQRFEDLVLSPFVDIIEDDKHFKVEVEMPGMSEDNVKVSISDHTLYITGEKSTSSKDENKNYLMREIHYGRYHRSVHLPDYLETDNAKATFKKGMLWVVIPKSDHAQSKSRSLKIEKA